MQKLNEMRGGEEENERSEETKLLAEIGDLLSRKA